MAEEERQPVSPVAYLPTEILEIILDPSSIIERIRHDLKGESGPYIRALKDENDKPILDEQGQQLPETYWVVSGMPFMNEYGIAEMIKLLNKYVNRNTIFSQISEEGIAKKMLILDYNIIDLFSSKYVEYAIDINRMSIVKDSILDICDFAMKQSQNKALIDALTKLFSVSEIRDTTKKGFSLSDLSPLKLLKRGESA